MKFLLLLLLLPAQGMATHLDGGWRNDAGAPDRILLTLHEDGPIRLAPRILYRSGVSCRAGQHGCRDRHRAHHRGRSWWQAANIALKAIPLSFWI